VDILSYGDSWILIFFLATCILVRGVYIGKYLPWGGGNVGQKGGKGKEKRKRRKKT
jgi:hypothetical protein